MLVLVLGGTRSGKSAVAETLAARLGSPVTYVATAWADPDDDDMATRIAAHRARRPAEWVTVEAGGDLIGALRSYPDGTLLVDALGPWVAAHPDFAVDVDALVTALQSRTGPTVVVSEEVGMAVHAPTELGPALRGRHGDPEPGRRRSGHRRATGGGRADAAPAAARTGVTA